jgi:hypothetical protein
MASKDFIHYVNFQHEAEGFERDNYIAIESNQRMLSKTDLELILHNHIIEKNPKITNLKRGFKLLAVHTILNK